MKTSAVQSMLIFIEVTKFYWSVKNVCHSNIVGSFSFSKDELHQQFGQLNSFYNYYNPTTIMNICFAVTPRKTKKPLRDGKLSFETKLAYVVTDLKRFKQ